MDGKRIGRLYDLHHVVIWCYRSRWWAYCLQLGVILFNVAGIVLFLVGRAGWPFELAGCACLAAAVIVLVQNRPTRHHEIWVREEIAESHRRPKTLVLLSQDPQPAVRRAVASNPALPKSLFAVLVHDPDEQVRREALHNQNCPRYLMAFAELASI